MSTTGWIILIYLLVSAIGGWLSRKQQLEREAGQRRGPRPTPDRDQDPLRSLEEQDRGGGPLAGEPLAGGAPRPQTPEEIAAEIRRVMGLEREEARERMREEAYVPPVEPPRRVLRPQPVARTSAPESDPLGSLAERHLDKLQGNLDRRHISTLRSGIEGRHLGSLADRYQSSDPVPTVRRYTGSRHLDLSDPARAIVTMEVLGPPKALRDDF